MAELGNSRCGWIGDGPEIRGITRISKSRDLTPEFMSKIAEDFDFFVSPAIADPNPTTILESMAWGFPVICTPQSGYYETGYRRNIFIDNIKKSVNVLKDMQYANESELLKMADEAREIVIANYNWDKFTDTVIQNLGLK
jgi:glycosyltransferase involved in cell wall biosynthesis